MYCARVLRTPKRFESSTGSNVSTSTPVSAIKSFKLDEPDHSPIEKSHDNTEELHTATRCSGRFSSPSKMCGSYLRNKLLMNLQNKHSTPISRTSGHIRCEDDRNNKSKPVKIGNSKHLNQDDKPVHGLRMSPRDLKTTNAKIRKNFNELSSRVNEKSNKSEGIHTLNSVKKCLKSNIPMRRKSVSLQDLALLTNKCPTSELVKIDTPKQKTVNGKGYRLNQDKAQSHEKAFELKTNSKYSKENFTSKSNQPSSQDKESDGKKTRKSSTGVTTVKNNVTTKPNTIKCNKNDKLKKMCSDKDENKPKKNNKSSLIKAKLSKQELEPVKGNTDDGIKADAPSDAEKLSKISKPASNGGSEDNQDNVKPPVNGMSDAGSLIQENINKTSNTDATCRNSFGSQANASNKASFVKRKLYSQMDNFNDNSENAETSFLGQKDIRDIYCMKKKNTSDVTDSKRLSGGKVLKNKDSPRKYSLRVNNKNNKPENIVKNTSEFVSKILNDINHKSNPVKEVDGCLEKNDSDPKPLNEHKDDESKEIENELRFQNDIFDTTPDPKLKDTKGKHKTSKKSQKTSGNKKEKKKHVLESPNKSLRASARKNMAKKERSAKSNAIDKIHNWSLNMSKKRTKPVAVNKPSKKAFVVKRVHSYVVHEARADDRSATLSPHLREAISKLKQQQSSCQGKKPVRRSLEISLKRKKAILTNDIDLKINNQGYGVEGKINTNRKKLVGGQTLTFKNGQMFAVNKGSMDYLDNSEDSVYHNTQMVKQTPATYYDHLQTKEPLDGSIVSLVDKYKNPTPLWNQPSNSYDTCRQINKPKPQIDYHSEINKMFICPFKFPQALPSNINTNKIVPTSSHHSEFKIPSGRYMPERAALSYTVNTKRNVNGRFCDSTQNMSYWDSTSVYRNSSKSVGHKQNKHLQENNFSITSCVPDYIRNPYVKETPFAKGISFCAKGIEVMKRADSKSNLALSEISAYTNKEPRAYVKQVVEKRKYAGDVNDLTVVSKKTKYDDDMSLCSSIQTGHTLSHKNVYNGHKNNAKIGNLMTNQSVCQFLIGGPLLYSNKLAILNDRSVRRGNDLNYPNLTKQSCLERKDEEYHFFNDANETIVSAQTHVTNKIAIDSTRDNTQYTVQDKVWQLRTEKTSDLRQSYQPKRTQKLQYTQKSNDINFIDQQSELSDLFQHRSDDNRAEKESLDVRNVKKYKFSSEDVYTFGKKPTHKNKDVENMDTFYFKGLYNQIPQVSTNQVDNTTSSVISKSEDTFRKPPLYNSHCKKMNNSSILSKYVDLHSTVKSKNSAKHKSKKMDNTWKQADMTVKTPLKNIVEKINVDNRTMISPWRFW